MKSINTLVEDIYKLVGDRDAPLPKEFADSVSRDIGIRLEEHFGRQDGERGTLRLSKMGPQCPCSLWYSVHHPELAEALPPWAKIKYAYGHVLEALAIALAKAAGHSVVGEQDELFLDGIRGHRDCVIDGCIVDVKSCSSIQFAKYKTGSVAQDDSFGYLDQLDGYILASALDDLVQVKDKGYILAIDKTLGHCCLYEHRVRPISIIERIRKYKEIIRLDNPPACTCGEVSDGKSGNRRLDTRASYSPYKFACRPDLRVFLYSDGPRYLTHVQRLPDVPEIDRTGQIIYN